MNTPQPDQFERLLRSHPAPAPVRPHLAAQTLQQAAEAKRAQLVRRWLVVLGLAAVVLALAKWLSNDLLYLLQLAFTKLHVIRAQGDLYLAAVWESLPKVQMLTIGVTTGLWLAWRRYETSLTQARITSVNQQGLAMKLITFTPRLAVASALCGVTALGVSGYTYAQKVQQHKLEILRTHVNQSGRTQLDTNMAKDECVPVPGQNYTGKFEIKKSAHLGAEEAQNVIRAACEAAAATAYLQSKYPPVPPTQTTGASFDTVLTSQPSRITGRSGDKIMVEVSYGGSSTQAETLQLSSDATVYQPGTGQVGMEKLKPGTIVELAIKHHAVKVGNDDYAAAPQTSEVAGAYIMPADINFEWYAKRNLVTQIQYCAGNPQDTCSFTGSIDFFPSGGGEGNNINPSFVNDRSLEMKEISGTITEIAPTYTKIKSSSGRIFTINFGSNPTADFNRARSTNYNNQKVGVGDTLLIRYAEVKDKHDTVISQDHIFNAVLMIEFLNKTDPVQKY